jgi:hypothetical protein
MQLTGSSRGNNGKAIASMVSGIVGWVLCGPVFCLTGAAGFVTLPAGGLGALCLAPLLCIPPIGYVVAVITGHVSLREIATRGEGGRGMAIAGLVMGYLGIGLFLIYICVTVVLPLLGLGGATILSLPWLVGTQTPFNP